MSSKKDSAIDAAAQLVATNPGADKRALMLHHRRPDGHCAGCQTRLTWWPCAMATIAMRAGEIGAQGGQG